MSEEEVYNQLNNIFRNHFNDPDLDVSAQTTANDVDGWDSLAHIRLVIAVEKSFGIKFKTSEVASFENVGTLANTIIKKTAS